MILTCNACPRQIAFPGRARDKYAGLFGWTQAGGRYLCGACSDALPITNSPSRAAFPDACPSARDGLPDEAGMVGRWPMSPAHPFSLRSFPHLPVDRVGCVDPKAIEGSSACVTESGSDSTRDRVSAS